MGNQHTKDLLKFLKPFNDETKELVLLLREFVWDLYPKTNELIYDNYNEVALGWSPTDRVSHLICNIAVGRTSNNVHFGFYYGTALNDTDNKLIGEGNQYRYLLVTSIKKFPKTYMKKLLKEAYANSLAKVKDENQLMEGKTITKSISEKKRELKKKPVNKK